MGNIGNVAPPGGVPPEAPAAPEGRAVSFSGVWFPPLACLPWLPPLARFLRPLQLPSLATAQKVLLMRGLAAVTVQGCLSGAAVLGAARAAVCCAWAVRS